MALRSARAPHSSMMTETDNTGVTIQMATPSRSSPNNTLMCTIQAPARGSRLPAERPVSSSGTLMPMAMANNAVPPSTTSPVWLMYTRAPASGAATQGPTIREDTAPSTKTLASLPPCSPPLTLLSLPCRPCGSSS